MLDLHYWIVHRYRSRIVVLPVLFFAYFLGSVLSCLRLLLIVVGWVHCFSILQVLIIFLLLFEFLRNLYLVIGFFIRFIGNECLRNYYYFHLIIICYSLYLHLWLYHFINLYMVKVFLNIIIKVLVKCFNFIVKTFIFFFRDLTFFISGLMPRN